MLRQGFESCRTARWAVREPVQTLANSLDNESLIACVPRQRRTETGGSRVCRGSGAQKREERVCAASAAHRNGRIACVPRQRRTKTGGTRVCRGSGAQKREERMCAAGRRTETRRPAAILQKHGGLRRSVLVVRQGMCYNNTYYRLVYLSLDPDDGTPARTTFLFVGISA